MHVWTEILILVLHVLQSSLVVLADAQTAALRCSEGGSLSDSGISDTGSDQEPSERERRLANLRRLARQLEAVLGPGSRALDNMREVSKQLTTLLSIHLEDLHLNNAF